MTTENPRGAQPTPLPTLPTALVPGVLALADAAAQHDGVAALGEETLLQVRGAAPGARRHHVVVADDDGTVHAYAHLDLRGAEGVAELVVHPGHRRRGLGDATLTAVHAVAATHAPDAPVHWWAHGTLPAARGLAARHGLAASRRLLTMHRPLDATLPLPATPQGVVVGTFRPGLDDADWLALNAEVFAWHPEQGRWTADDLRARLDEDWFDPAGFFLARAAAHPTLPDGALAGFHWTKVHGHPEHRVGEVYVVGVAAAAQGGGLGRALTLVGLHHLAAQGLDTVELYVEGDNTAALAVYDRLGFTLLGEDTQFTTPRARTVNLNVTP